MSNRLDATATPVNSDATAPISLYGWIVGHWFVGLCFLVVVWTPFMFSMPFYTTYFAPTFATWWGVKGKGTGHTEMTVPTYFFLWSTVPTFVGLLVFLVVRSKSAPFGTPVAHFLHRKPTLLMRFMDVSYGEMLFVAIMSLGHVLIFYYQMDRQYNPKKTTTKDFVKNGAFAISYNGLFNLVLLALPASRHCFWMEWLNIPFARAVKYHRWLAVATVLIFAAHATLFVVIYSITNKLSDFVLCTSCNIGKEGLHPWANFFGMLAYACMLIMAFTALPIIRRKYFVVFRTAHYLAIPAALLAVMHYGPIIDWIYASMVIYILNKMFSTATSSTPVTVQRAIALPDSVVELTLQCASGYIPGDAVWLNVPALSTTQWHPFSIASSPLHTPGLLTLYVRNLGKWTNGLYQYVGQCQRDQVHPIIYMDGGYRLSAPLIPPRHSDVVFVAGGIGVTPLMGQLVHVLRSNPKQNIWFIWHVRRSTMLLQFHSWLENIRDLATSTGGRLNLRLHVTQEQSTVNVTEDSLTFVHPKIATEPRPYIIVSTTQRFWVVVLAFGVSSGLLAVIKYGNKLTAATTRGNLWPLQRMIEFCVVVVGCYVALIVTYIKPSSTPAKRDSDGGIPEIKDTDAATFISSFNVQFHRIVWADFGREVGIAAHGPVSVYVSGPKTLRQAIDEEFQGKAKYEVHHEVFEI
ncbi:unnamed protein product [Aphanomyces euteiches]